MKVEIVSDTICPWCYIGEKKFTLALNHIKTQYPDLPVEVEWRPFQLYPETPKEGVNRKEAMKRKFGGGRQGREIAKTIEHNGAAVGIRFNFEAQEKTPNTLDSHRLIRWSKSAGCQDAVVEALFRGYFIEGRDIGDPEVLTAIAEESGMDASIVSDLLKTDADESAIRAQDIEARELGIAGVPAFIFNEKFTVGGAQDVETFVRIMNKVIEKLEPQT